MEREWRGGGSTALHWLILPLCLSFSPSHTHIMHINIHKHTNAYTATIELWPGGWVCGSIWKWRVANAAIDFTLPSRWPSSPLVLHPTPLFILLKRNDKQAECEGPLTVDRLVECEPMKWRSVGARGWERLKQENSSRFQHPSRLQSWRWKNLRKTVSLVKNSQSGNE